MTTGRINQGTVNIHYYYYIETAIHIPSDSAVTVSSYLFVLFIFHGPNVLNVIHTFIFLSFHSHIKHPQFTI
jgi:hypothetical protein